MAEQRNEHDMPWVTFHDEPRPDGTTSKSMMFHRTREEAERSDDD